MITVSTTDASKLRARMMKALAFHLYAVCGERGSGLGVSSSLSGANGLAGALPATAVGAVERQRSGHLRLSWFHDVLWTNQDGKVGDVVQDA